jgi:hypothetical protein
MNLRIHLSRPTVKALQQRLQAAYRRDSLPDTFQFKRESAGDSQVAV